MQNQTNVPVLPTEAFDAIFRAESLEERVEFRTCDIYSDLCQDDPGGDPGNPGGEPGVTVTPEPATLLMSAVGLGGVGVVSYLRRRSARRRDDAQGTPSSSDESAS
jgi:hypothetical protein